MGGGAAYCAARCRAGAVTCGEPEGGGLAPRLRRYRVGAAR